MSRPLPPLRPDLSPAAERVTGQSDRVFVRRPDGLVEGWLEADWRILLLADGRRTAAEITGVARAVAAEERAAPAGATGTMPGATPAGATTAAEVTALFRRARAAGLLLDRRRRPVPPMAVLAWRPLSPAEATLPVQVLSEARYQCEMCGESCSAGYEVGPVPRPLPIDALETVPFPVAEGPPFPTTPGRGSRRDASGGVGAPELEPHLRRVDGLCSQLDCATGLCRIHARHGIDRKPRACQEFPLLLSLTPTGLRLSLQWECTRLHRSLTLAPPLATHLSGPPVGAQAAIAPEVLPLGDGRLVSFAAYARLEARLLAGIATGDPDRLALSLPLLIAGLGRRSVDLGARLAGLERDDAAEGLAETPAKGLAETPAKGLAKTPTETLAETRAEGLAETRAEGLAETPVETLAENLVLEASGLIEQLYRDSRALEPAATLLAPTDRRRIYRRWMETVLEQWRAGAAVALPALETPDLWRAWLRNRIFGLGLLKAPSLFAGAVDVALRYLIARAGRSIPLPVPMEGSPGDEENRRLVAVEHSMREERVAGALEAEDDALADWLEELG